MNGIGMPLWPYVHVYPRQSGMVLVLVLLMISMMTALVMLSMTRQLQERRVINSLYQAFQHRVATEHHA